MDVAAFYHSAGGGLFPLTRYKSGDPASKRPLKPNWPTTDYTDAEIGRYRDRGHSIAWRIPTTGLVIDVDVQSDEGHAVDGRESFARLVADVGINLSLTPCVESPTGGRHYYLTVPAGTPLRKSHPDYPGIDFLGHGRYVVAAGSRHWQGDYYRFCDSTQLLSLAPSAAPAGLLAKVKKPAPTTRTAAAQLTIDQVAELLNLIPVEDFRGQGGDRWPELMIAVHAATGGSPEGLGLFQSWCWDDPEYVGDESIAARWASCEPDGPITSGTLIKFARQAVDAADEEDKPAGLKILRDFDAALDYADVPLEDPAEAGPPRPVRVLLNFDEAKAVSRAAGALKQLENLYQRSGALVHVTRLIEPPAWQQHAKNSRIVAELPESVLRTRLTECCTFLAEVADPNGGKALMPRRVPAWVVKPVFQAGSWEKVPPIRGLVQSPCMLHGGKVLQNPGFNSDYGLLYEPNQSFPNVPEFPTPEDAREAVERMKGVVCDFPFVTDAHRSVWLAAVLTLLTRFSYHGPAPMFFVDANASGVGKTLLIESVGLIATGRQVPAMACPVNDEEMEKRLTTIIRQGTPVHLIDNVPNHKRFGFASLDAAITSGVWESRILGKSESTGELPVNTVFFATGNNVELGTGADAARRLCYCRLDWEGEDPTARNNFVHGADGGLKSWIQKHRGDLVKDALTIVRAYHVANCPDVGLKPWGSFREWSEAVRAPIVWVGEPDPRDTHELLMSQADSAGDELAMVLDGWQEIAGREPLRVSDMLTRSDEWDGDSKRYPRMDEALADVLDPEGKRNSRAIGGQLRRFAGKTNRDRRLLQVRSNGLRGWQVKTNTAAETDDLLS